MAIVAAAARAAAGEDGFPGSPKIKRKKTVEQTYQKKTQARASQGSTRRSAFELISLKSLKEGGAHTSACACSAPLSASI